MTTTQAATGTQATQNAPTIVTPTLRRGLRRSLFWIIAATFLLVVAIAGLVLSGGAGTNGIALSPTSAGPSGSKALAEVLRQQGVKVDAVDGYAAATSALSNNAGSTLMVIDPEDYLSASRLQRLATLATHTVLVTPTYSMLDALTPYVEAAGSSGSRPLKADCGLPAAQNAGVVSAGSGYRLVGPGAEDAALCFGSGDRVYSVVQVRSDSTDTTIVGVADAFANEHIAEQGNAALAIGLLGSSQHLVWYLPGIDDAALDGAPTIAQLTPPWVPTVLLLLLLVAIAAAFWRGRRMGPLVVENLPVVVRSSETMEGRARLYQRGSARLRAVDALRIGAIARLAAQCGLPRLATVDEVIMAVAGVTRRDPALVRGILLDSMPNNERDLVSLSDALLDLERAAASNLRPSNDHGE
ncbi:MAG: hypothetical protein JWO10_2212 [Microbacteriaceae bacterium]|nr:hypothetical protein [Microbacteriaceae bacterium]